jgi:AcrR family transcriptional regulator
VTDVAPYRHGRVPRAVRLAQVLDLAAGLIVERGYAGASMDELARRAGVSKPVVYDLVGSKEQLFRTLMAQLSDDLASRVVAAVSAETDPEARLVAGARAWFGFVADNRDGWLAFLTGGDAPVGEEVLAIRRRQGTLVAGLLGESAATFGARPDPVLLDAAANVVNGAFEALGSWWGDHPEVDADDLALLCARIVYPGLVAVLASAPDGWG